MARVISTTTAATRSRVRVGQGIPGQLADAVCTPERTRGSIAWVLLFASYRF